MMLISWQTALWDVDHFHILPKDITVWQQWVSNPRSSDHECCPLTILPGVPVKMFLSWKTQLTVAYDGCTAKIPLPFNSENWGHVGTNDYSQRISASQPAFWTLSNKIFTHSHSILKIGTVLEQMIFHKEFRFHSQHFERFQIRSSLHVFLINLTICTFLYIFIRPISHPIQFWKFGPCWNKWLFTKNFDFTASILNAFK